MQSHISPVRKMACEIAVVDPANTQSPLQGITRVGPVHIAVYTTSPFFRWPVVGENWLIREENGTWYLDGILQNEDDATHFKSIAPGEGHINVTGKIQTSRGTVVPQKFVQVVGDGSKKPWTISHSLNAFTLAVGAINASTKVPITAFTWEPATKEGKPDPNNLTITFTVAPATKGAEVVVIG